MVQLVGIELKLRLTFENDVVLIHLRIHRADLPLTKGVIQCVIDGCRRDAEPRSCNAVNHQRYGQPSRLLIGGNIFQFGQLLQLPDEPVSPVVEFIGVGVFERVLVLRSTYTVIDRNVLHRLHEQLNSLHLAEL